MGTSNTAMGKITAFMVITFLWWKQTIKKLIKCIYYSVSDGKCHGETQGRDRRVNLNKMVRERPHWEGNILAKPWRRKGNISNRCSRRREEKVQRFWVSKDYLRKSKEDNVAETGRVIGVNVGRGNSNNW